MSKVTRWLLLAALAVVFCGSSLLYGAQADAANPYLPHWEHIPDGEPKLFEDPDNPGKYRAYIYGSHDIRKTEYCGDNLVLWSAPAENLNDWRYEGEIFRHEVDGVGDIFYAPDVVETKDAAGNKVYYLYPNNRSSGRYDMIAKSNSPKGPFEVCNWKEGSTTETEGVLGYDAALFVDDDGRVYGYWGFESSEMAELDPETMCTVKEGCKVLTEEDTGIDNCKTGDTFRFFEASSIRKVEDKYVFIYSRKTNNGEFGLGPSNCTLAYAYSDTPLGPWTYGGTIIDARARETDQDGNVITSMTTGNTHGSILEVNGQWYVFYHRCIDNSQTRRQGVVEPVDVRVTEDGKVEIKEAEVTSQGFEIGGLNPYKKLTGGSACYITGGAQIASHYDEWNPGSNAYRISNGSIVGYKYFNFDAGRGTRTKDMLAVSLVPKGKPATIQVMLDRPWESAGGKLLGTIEVSESDDQGGVIKTIDVDGLSSLTGKHALFFVFSSSKNGAVCELEAFQFGEATVTDEDEGQDPPPAETPDVTPTAAPGQEPSNTPPASASQAPAGTPVPSGSPASPVPGPVSKVVTGRTYTSGSLTYKVTNVEKRTATVTGVKKKTLTSIKVPNTVTIEGEKFRVTAIGKSAFKGCKKAVKATIGKNVTEIGSQAFASCKKLKNIAINTTSLKKVGKNACKGIQAKAKIKAPKKKLAAYKKMFKTPKGVKWNS